MNDPIYQSLPGLPPPWILLPQSESFTLGIFMEILILMTIGVIVVAGVITYLSGRNHELSLRWNEMSLRKKLTLRTGTDTRWGSVQSLSKLLDEAGFGDDQMTQKYLIRLKVMENHRYGCSDNSN